jgi:hypothetical protein
VNEVGEDEDSEELELDPGVLEPELLALALGDADEEDESVELAAAEELELDPTLDELDGEEETAAGEDEDSEELELPMAEDDDTLAEA